MKKIIVSSLMGAALIVSTTVSTFAADHTELGTPGTPNCVGQSTAAIAQLGKNADVEGVRGVGGVIHFLNASGEPITNQELKAAIAAYCAGE